jgi:hypothetical protein
MCRQAERPHRRGESTFAGERVSAKTRWGGRGWLPSAKCGRVCAVVLDEGLVVDRGIRAVEHDPAKLVARGHQAVPRTMEGDEHVAIHFGREGVLVAAVVVEGEALGAARQSECGEVKAFLVSFLPEVRCVRACTSGEGCCWSGCGTTLFAMFKHYTHMKWERGGKGARHWFASPFV